MKKQGDEAYGLGTRGNTLDFGIKKVKKAKGRKASWGDLEMKRTPQDQDYFGSEKGWGSKFFAF